MIVDLYQITNELPDRLYYIYLLSFQVTILTVLEIGKEKE